MGRDERRYLLARAIQFFLPGVPQVYYVGLLAGVNDMALLKRTRVGRDINRHYYTQAEIHAAVQRPVVQDLFALIRLRNEHAAFGGEFAVANGDSHVIEMTWRRGADFAQLYIDLRTADYRLEYSTAQGRASLRFASRGPLPCAA